MSDEPQKSESIAPPEPVCIRCESTATEAYGKGFVHCTACDHYFARILAGQRVPR